MSKNYDEAFNFLLFSYFGIKNKNQINNEESKNKCAKRAYLDLARTIRYSVSSTKLERMKGKKSTQKEKKEADEFIKEKENLIIEICSEMIDSIFSYDRKIPFDCWHCKLCEKIKNKMNESGLIKTGFIFTHGQAQKWINMTLKYLWLLNMLPENIFESDLHVPVDSYIIEAALSDNPLYGLKLGLKYKEKVWSQWEDKIYLEFQNDVKRKMKGNPMEWESRAWIGISKNK